MMGKETLESLTLFDLRFLLEVDRMRSLTKAGAALNLSPSKASRTMKRIREALGDPCYATTKGGLIPTEYVEHVLPIVEELLETGKKLEPVQFDPKTCNRTFRLSCVMAEAAHLMGGVLPMMLAEAPNTRLDLTKNEDEFASLFSRQSDFAVVTGVNLPPDVHYMRLYPLDRVILLRNGHPLTQLNRDVLTEDVTNFGRVTIVTGRSSTWTGPDQDIFPFERYMAHTRLSTSRLNVGWEAVQNTDLICVCGWRAAEIAMRAYDLTAMALPADCKVTNPWNMLIWPDFTHQDPACRWLRSVFSRWVEKEKARMALLRSQGKGPPGYDCDEGFNDLESGG